MPVKGKDFLEVAQQNKELGTEIGHRQAVSRAYYAGYHSVCDLIEGPIPNYRGGSKHSSLITYLGNRNDEPFDQRKLLRLSVVLRMTRDKPPRSGLRTSS